MHRFKRDEDDRGSVAAGERAETRDQLASDGTDRPVADESAQGERTAVAERPAASTATDDDRTMVGERPAGAATETEREERTGTAVTARAVCSASCVAALLTAILAAAGAALDLTTTASSSW